jgi:hypothetical protein
MTSPDFPTPSMDPRRGDAIESMLRATVAGDADARQARRSHRRTRGILIASIATACIVVAGGVGYASTRGSVQAPHGGGGVAVPSSGPSSGPSATTKPTGSGAPAIVDPAGTATPVPTPTPTANTPTEVDTWTITTDGIGPLVPGMTKAAADDVADNAGLAISTCGDGVGVADTHFFSIVDGPQFAVTFDAGGRVSSVVLVGSFMTPAHSGGPLTPHGIGLGSTRAELTQTYPDLRSVPPGNAGETGYSLGDGAGHWIDFVTDNSLGTVQEIIVDTDDSVPSEFCG